MGGRRFGAETSKTTHSETQATLTQHGLDKFSLLGTITAWVIELSLIPAMIVLVSHTCTMLDYVG